MAKEINYFGYGANKNDQMIKAMIGRVPYGSPAILKNFELCIEHWHEIKKGIVRNMLKNAGWDKNFRTYCIRHAKGKQVDGTLWRITKQEHNMIGMWEIHKVWYKLMHVITVSGGKSISAITEIIDDMKLKSASEIYGRRYPTFINNRAKMLKEARSLRKRVNTYKYVAKSKG